MASPIRIKRSAVPLKRPGISDLQLGELALNTYDGKLFTKQDTNGVGIGTTITLLTPWQETYGGSSIYYEGDVGIKTTETRGYELYVDGNANISGIVTASAFYSDTGNLETIINTKIDGIEVRDSNSVVGSSITAINFDEGLSVGYYSGIVTVTSSTSSIGVLYNDINIGAGFTSLNFIGSGISSVTGGQSGVSTITIDLQSNLDGGLPSTNYGGIEAIEGGNV